MKEENNYTILLKKKCIQRFAMNQLIMTTKTGEKECKQTNQTNRKQQQQKLAISHLTSLHQFPCAEKQRLTNKHEHKFYRLKMKFTSLAPE